MFYQIPLQAGIEFAHGVPGRVFLLDDIGDASNITVKLVKNGNERLISSGRKKAFKAIMDFDSVVLVSAVDTIVNFFISFDDVDIGIEDGARFTIINDDTNPVPVRTPAGEPLEVSFAGTVEPVFGQLILPDTVTNSAPVAVAAVAGAVVAASATRRGLRLRNVGDNPVAMGGAGVTYANAVVLIQPGEIWNENEAPGAAWYAICDAGKASTLNIQTVE